jgi:diguanylate cyclase (GGDEF)-like protein
VIEKFREIYPKIEQLNLTIDDRNFIETAHKIVVGGISDDMEERLDERERIDRAIIALSQHHYFKDCKIEIYLKEENKLKCAAVEGVEDAVRQKMIDKEFDESEILSDDPNKTLIKLNNLGILVIKSKNPLDDYKKRFLQYFAEKNLTTPIENASKYIDALIINHKTGLYKSSYFKKQLENELDTRSETALIFIDIDYFRDYNSNVGHDDADDAIETIADIIKKNIRKGDIPARYGGDEFAVILKNISIENAFNVAEKIRKEIERYKFTGEILQPNGKLTVSIGIAHSPEHAYYDSKKLLKCADIATYISKWTGRNKCTVYDAIFGTEREKIKSNLEAVVKYFSIGF